MKRYNEKLSGESRKLIYVLLLTLSPLMAQSQQIITIDTLFNQLRLQPVSKADHIRIEQASAFTSFANSQLYPNIELIGRYDYGSIPTAMYPLPPNDLLVMVKDQAIGQPFSNNIYRVGASISMPLFVKSIYSIASQAKMMVHSAEDQQHINLLKNEATIVSANANLHYIQELDSALQKKNLSLLKTREIATIKVNNGRSPAAALININDAINEIGIIRNDLALQKEEIVATIANLTGASLVSAVPMERTGTYQDGEIIALDPLRKKVEADKLAFKAEKEKLLPSLILQGNYSNNFGTAYNNDKQINGAYTTVGVALKVPLFTKGQYAQISKSKLDAEASQNDLNKLTIEFTVQASQLENSLRLLENSAELYTNSIRDKEELLEMARVSYTVNQMTIDDYLKYEDDVVLEKTKLFKAQSQSWQVLMKLAVIYGNDIQTLVK